MGPLIGWAQREGRYCICNEDDETIHIEGALACVLTPPSHVALTLVIYAFNLNKSLRVGHIGEGLSSSSVHTSMTNDTFPSESKSLLVEFSLVCTFDYLLASPTTLDLPLS